MFRDLPAAWQAYTILVYAAVVVVIVLNLKYVVPSLWRAGRVRTRIWLSPDKRSNVVDRDARRRQLDAAAGRRA